jgi:hypothetical protein
MVPLDKKAPTKARAPTRANRATHAPTPLVSYFHLLHFQVANRPLPRLKMLKAFVLSYLQTVNRFPFCLKML